MLLKIVPILEPFKSLIFHGGTILNFFCTDKFKRYSVDLDAVFVPYKNINSLSRKEIDFLINKELSLLKQELLKPENKEKLNIIQIGHSERNAYLKVQAIDSLDKTSRIEVKIELNKNYIGLIAPFINRTLGKEISALFNKKCHINSVADIQLYGGKVIALLGRNTIKDTYDFYRLLKEKRNLIEYKEGILYNLLSGKTSALNMLTIDCNTKPKEFKRQIIELGTTNDFTLQKHIEIREKYKGIITNMMGPQDYYYILASVLGVLDQTDYKFKHMYGIKVRNDINRQNLIKNIVFYKKNVADFIMNFPIMNNETLLLYSNYTKYIDKQIKSPTGTYFTIKSTTGISR